MARALDISHTTISAYYRKKAGLTKSTGKAGAVTLIQRFGGSLNLNVHFHQLFIDGAYAIGDQGAPTDFIRCDPPTNAELDQVIKQIIKKLTRYLERQKIIIKDEASFQLPIDEEDTFSRLQASSVTYRFATGISKGKKALVLKALTDTDHNARSGLVSANSGFSLHAGVACEADEREKLERVCRYIARPAIAENRLFTSANGDVIYKLKKPWDDGTLAIRLTPLELMERLAALVPRPRVHLTRFHGVLGPHYKYRKQIVPKQKITELSMATDSAEEKPKAHRIGWARLLKRVFGIDVETCPKCKGRVKIIAAIEDPKVIKQILNHLGLPSSPPVWTPARAPPTEQPDFFSQEFPNHP
jgi:hypothetical protein